MYNLTSSMRYANMPSQTSSNEEYQFWHKYWNIIRDVIMGDIMIKRRTTYYLPRLETQTDEEYKSYLLNAVFYNMTAKTVNSLTGAIHCRDPLIENIPETVDLLNVTKDGQSFNVFAKKMTRELVSIGRYGVLVDAPEQGGDAYFASYVAEDILDWSYSTINGRTKTNRVVLREYTTVKNSLGTSELSYYVRELFLNNEGVYTQRVYPDGDVNSNNFKEIIPKRNGEILREIPFLFLSPYDFSTDVEKPPILDIAILNLAHYRSYAHLQSGRFFTATPVWAAFLSGGADENIEYKIGGNNVWQFGSQDDAKILEFEGAGLKYMENALDMIEHQIVSIGGKLGTASRGSAAESDTSVSSREKGEQTFIHSMLTILGDGLTALLREMCLWNGTPSPNLTVRLPQESLNLYISDRDIRAIKSLYETGLIPVEALYGIFKDANIIPSNMSMQEFKDRLPQTSPQSSQEMQIETHKNKLQERRILKQIKNQPTSTSANVMKTTND